MNICIVGWYGTETMGDRAILDGILSIIAKIDHNSCIMIGSLFPFYTQRTLLEEKKVYNRTAPLIELRVFDSRDQKVCDKNIEKSDLIIMGGGPLMDLDELFIIKHIFKVAKKKRIPSIVMGCGLGPLNKKEYQQCVAEILDISSAVSFRDDKSMNIAYGLFGANRKYVCLGDPAIVSVENYKKSQTKSTSEDDSAVINLRRFPNEYGKVKYISDDDIRQFVIQLANQSEKIKMVPMHTFFIGGDDRKYFIELLYGIRNERIEIIHKPMNLDELYHCFSSCELCVGMRYHSVVMQTILNGNNYIINYTDSHNGKIVGFLNGINQNHFYDDRIVDLQSISAKADLMRLLGCIQSKDKYHYQYSNIEKNYSSWIKDALNS